MYVKFGTCATSITDFMCLQVYQSEDALETHPCQTSDEATCIYISHSSSTKEQVDAVLDVIKFDLHGMAGLIIQQM